MAGEAAANICSSIAQEVRDLRLTGSPASVALNSMVDMLCHAPAFTTVDALALAAVSRKMLATAIGEFQPDDIEHMDESRLAATFVLVFLHRVVETLEIQTGFGAEGFTGEADALN